MLGWPQSRARLLALNDVEHSDYRGFVLVSAWGKSFPREAFANCVFDTRSIPRCSMKSLDLLKSFRRFLDFRDHNDR